MATRFGTTSPMLTPAPQIRRACRERPETTPYSVVATSIIYSLFVERAHALVKPDGMVGLLTPSGIASDLSASAFFRNVATGGRLKALYDFENRRVFFADVHASFKFAVMVASPARTFEASKCAFYLHSVGTLADDQRAFPIAASDFARVNPNTGTAPIFRSRRDMSLTTAIYERLPVLVDRSGGQPVGAWPVRYVRMFDMTNDSGLFRNRTELEEREGAWPVGGNHFQSAAGEWVPLYEGKMVQAFDHRAASVVINPANVKRPAQPFETTLTQHSDPSWLPDPQFWVLNSGVSPRGEWHVGMKHVTATTNVRSMIVAIIPESGAGNSLPVIDMAGDAKAAALVVGTMNSVPFDFVLRQKVQGQNFKLVHRRAASGGPARRLLPNVRLKTRRRNCPRSRFRTQLHRARSLPLRARPRLRRCERRRAAAVHLGRRAPPPPPRQAGCTLFHPLRRLRPRRPRAKPRRYPLHLFDLPHCRTRGNRALGPAIAVADLCLTWINALMAGQPDAAISA